MSTLFHGLDLWVGLSLALALTFVLAFEFINGFHDTANAVATVIYTKAMPPHLAVVLSGIFNFLGVLLGGVGVAYAIVHLLPVELLINVDTGRGLAMVFAMLAAAIAWNLGTWYFGIPASSSHTLIGSILGVGLANALITDLPLAEGVNWGKAIDIGASLVVSPVAGFLVAGARIDHQERALDRIDRHAFRRLDAQQAVVDRARQLAAVQHQLVLHAEHVGGPLGHVVMVLVAALAHHVGEQDAALPGIHGIFIGGRPGIEGRGGDAIVAGSGHGDLL